MDLSDDDDFLEYTPMFRSQGPPRDVKPNLKSRLSLSFKSSQATSVTPKLETSIIDIDSPLKIKSTPSKTKPAPSKTKSTPSKTKTTPSKTKTTPSKIKTTPSKSSKTKIKKGTPVKSRADQPEENISPFELAKWHFLFGSSACKKEKPTPQKRKSDSEGESSRDSFASGSQHKKRTSLGEPVPHSITEKEDNQRCWHCKFPFKTDQEDSVHVILCSSKDLSNLPRCDAGSHCQETTQEHFLSFNHREESLEIKESCNDVNSNTIRKPLVKTNLDRSVSSVLRHDDTGGPSTSQVSSRAAESDDEFEDVIVISDNEDRTVTFKGDSMPLFDLEETVANRASLNKETVTTDNQKPKTSLDKETVTTENQDHGEPLDKEAVPSESSLGSSSVLDFSSALIPDLELHEGDLDDQETVIFSSSQPAHSPSHSFTEGDRQENQKSPFNHILDDSSGSETADLQNDETAANALDDPEGDELIASLSEEGMDQIAIPAMQRVIKWRKDCKEAQTSHPTKENKQSTGLKKPQNIVVQPMCFHFHYHEASSAPSHSKENGQTSILKYFSVTKPKEENCPCSEKQENIAVQQRLMGHKQKRSLVSLPSISECSSIENSSTKMSKTQERNNGTRQWGGRRASAEPKKCPFYKYIPETSFVVDAFSYGSVDGVTAYFLSHFHYDHYCGLQRNFSHPIYCSEITARLVNKRLGVPLQYLNPLPMWKPQVVLGVEVTLLDANHCPGAVMFLFKVKSGARHLHVGDFRAHPSMEKYEALQCSIHSLFLDTTYCSPEHVFPTQEKMIEKCVSLAQDHHLRNAKTLFVVGSYTIGKERVFKAIASKLNCSIWVKDYKKQVLNCINDKEILARLTQSKASAMVHVLPMSELKGQKLKDYLNQLRGAFTEIVGMCPTGWEFTSSCGVDDISSQHPYPDVHIYGIPYSEHSSFSELRQFVQFIKPKKIIPTVNNGSQASRKKMEQHFREWQTKRHLFFS